MKKNMMIAAALMLATPAFAQDTSGWNVGLGAGFDHLSPLKFAGPTYSGTETMSDGYQVSGAIGYRFFSNLRVALEVGYNSHDHDSTGAVSGTIPGLPATGTGTGTTDISSAQAVTESINAYYNLPLGDNWDWTLGGGVGMAENSTRLAVNNGSSVFNVAHGSDSGIFYQVNTGPEFHLSPGLDFSIVYNYRVSSSAHLASDATGEPIARISQRINQGVRLGINMTTGYVMGIFH